MTFNPKLKIRKVLVHFQCYFLFVRNLILTKKLTLKHFTYFNKLVVLGHEADIFWKVKGCHKIAIKKLGVFPGNISGIKFIYQAQQSPIEIIFYGIGGQELSKKVWLDTTQIELADKFTPSTNIPPLKSISLTQNQLVCVFNNSFQTLEQTNFTIDIKTPIIIPFSFKIEHEPFIKSNYPTQTL